MISSDVSRLKCQDLFVFSF